MKPKTRVKPRCPFCTSMRLTEVEKLGFSGQVIAVATYCHRGHLVRHRYVKSERE
jgi:hypothetical protein